MKTQQVYIIGDCLKLLLEMSDKSVDLVLTDPPYGINLDYGNTYIDSEENWFNLIKEAMPEMQRVGKMVIMPCCQIVRLEWIYKNFPPKWLIAWYKGSPGHRSNIGFNDWEPLLVYGWTKKAMHDFIQCQPTPFDCGHPCPKPVAWAKKLIEMSTEEGDTILDPFLGSGTTLRACRETNRNGIGFEINPDYEVIIKKRLMSETPSLKTWCSGQDDA